MQLPRAHPRQQQPQQGQSNALHQDHEWKMAAMQVFARMPNYQVTVSDFRQMAHELDAARGTFVSSCSLLLLWRWRRPQHE